MSRELHIVGFQVGRETYGVPITSLHEIVRVPEITAVPEVNKTYLGTVQRIADFGAFIEIMPGTDGLLHVSEIAEYRVRDVRDELTEGQQLLVKVINVDPSGKIRLSRKAVLRDERGEGGEEEERQPDFDREGGGSPPLR